MGRTKADVPRWKRKTPPPGPVVMVKGRKATRQLGQHLQAQSPQVTLTSSRPAFRWRKHLVPFWWLAGVTMTGLVLHATLPWAGVIAGPLAGTAVLMLTRHLDDWTRRACYAIAFLTAVWVPVLALAGLRPPAPLAGLACWALVTVPWVHHYRWRYTAPEAQPDSTDQETWARLAAKRKWAGYLGAPQRIPGGVRYPVILNGAETNIGEVMAHPRAIAAAWDKPITEAYAEPDPAGIESRGLLTLLKVGTLDRPREWNGQGADPQTGIAVIGRYPDDLDARIRFWVPRDGTRHGLVAGASGSGKSYLLDLIIRVAVASGVVVPIILDPQEGQSLPHWRGKVRYASGVDECMRMLKGIRDGMFGRSRDLAARTWTDEDGHLVQGMDFYDPHLTGLPAVLVIADEFPLLLTAAGKADAKRADLAISYGGDIAKLGRKTGVALWPVAQVPSLDELGSRVLRSMLVGGNVVCLRTGEERDAGMIGMVADPSTLPRYFRDGSPTHGLGYVIGPDNRQAPARADMVHRRVRRTIPQVPELDPAFAAALDAAMTGKLVASPAPAPVADSRPGRAADAILAVLDREMDRGEIISAVAAWCQEQGREPYALRTVTDALDKLVEAGRATKPGYNRYAPPRHLHAVAGIPARQAHESGRMTT